MKEKILPIRKVVRLKGYDYGTPGYYFVTICTKDKRKLLCDIVGTVVLDGPQIGYTRYGRIVEKYLESMCNFYEDIKIDKYIVMPNHVHLLVHVLDNGSGSSGPAIPTKSRVGRLVGTFKRLTNRECENNIWQSRSHDHIIRGEKDYRKIWEYIDTNPIRWTNDCFYIE